MTGENGQIEADAGWLEDLRDCLMFLTRLPVPPRYDGQHRPLSCAARAFPIAGAIVGVLSGLALLAAQGAGLPATLAASIALLAGVLATGGLHEDGLADVADGFGADGTVERKLDIMRDSQIGTYGVLALVFMVLLKVFSLSALVTHAQSVWHAPMLLIAAAAVSRTFIVVMMRALPPARGYGRSKEAGLPTQSGVRQALVAGLGTGSLMLWLACGVWAIIAGLLAGAAAYYSLKRVAMRHIGGQTGDVLGATQQMTETAIFVVLAATYC